MKTPSGRKRATRKRAPGGRGIDRRRHLELREVLDELVEHVRRLTSSVATLPPDRIEYAQERLEWLADEVWRLVMEAGEDTGPGKGS